jgi:hypothetical protein
MSFLDATDSDIGKTAAAWRRRSSAKGSGTPDRSRASGFCDFTGVPI